MAVWFYKLIRAIVIKIDPVALNPAFQYSIIPSFRPRLQQVHGIANWLWPGPEDQVFCDQINISENIQFSPPQKPSNATGLRVSLAGSTKMQPRRAAHKVPSSRGPGLPRLVYSYRQLAGLESSGICHRPNFQASGLLPGSDLWMCSELLPSSHSLSALLWRTPRRVEIWPMRRATSHLLLWVWEKR